MMTNTKVFKCKILKLKSQKRVKMVFARIAMAAILTKVKKTNMKKRPIPGKRVLT